MPRQFDVIIVGAGIAGASAAYELAKTRRVLVLERESHPGYHSSGRSAAMYVGSYGNKAIRGLSLASRPFLESPPAGFAEAPLMRPRGVLYIGGTNDEATLAAFHAEVAPSCPSMRVVGIDACMKRVPSLKPDSICGGVYDPDSFDLDADLLLQGFVRGARQAGARFVLDSEIQTIRTEGQAWEVVANNTAYAAPILVNAGGAWADEIAAQAGVRPVGLVPKRRTAVLFAAPDGVSVDTWPAVMDIHERFYFKPDAGHILASPADETPSAPMDAYPEDLDAAIAVDRVQRVAGFPVRRLQASWAGLRSFVADKTLVIGFAPDAPGFFWLAGQGGYGIQTAPTAARTARALIDGSGLPADVAALGVRARDLSPARPALSQ